MRSSISHSRPTIDESDCIAVQTILKSEMIAEGQCVAKFEHALSDYLGLFGGVATSSGTAALFLAIKALGLGPGDKIILPTYVCRSVLDAVRTSGATPILCDVGKDWCIDVSSVASRIKEQISAIIAVHTFGISTCVQELRKFGVPVIEDCSQGLGPVPDGSYLGRQGDVIVCSFHATKMLTTGEGGMVLSHRPEIVERLRHLRYGVDPMECQYKLPMSDIQAALGLSQLRRYDSFLERRQQIAERYFEDLGGLPILLPESVRNKSQFFRFPIRSQHDFKALRIKFEQLGVQLRRGVDCLLHRVLIEDSSNFLNGERCFSETVSLPIYPGLREHNLEQIIHACHKVFS